jgi:hypothetical protein
MFMKLTPVDTETGEPQDWDVWVRPTAIVAVFEEEPGQTHIVINEDTVWLVHESAEYILETIGGVIL